MKLIKDNKRDLMIGIAASLITAFIIKAGDWILFYAPFTGKSVIVYCENIIYTLAATQSNNSLDVIFWDIFLGTIAAIFIVVTQKMLSFLKKLQKFENSTDKLPEDGKKVVKGEVRQKETNQDDDSPTTDDIKEIEKNRKRKEGFKLMIELGIYVIVLHVLIFGTIIRPASLWSKFERDITMIYPYVEENHIYHLKSDWVCMRSKDDYKKIYEYINSIKQGFSLPN